MHTLFLDLGSHDGLIALVSPDGVSHSRSVDHRLQDHDLLPLLHEAGIAQEKIDRIACVIGPGGFTSLRVAVAFTNALAFALDVPVTGIHLSDLYGARFPPPPAPPPRGRGAPSIRGGVGVWWIHSTKKQEIFLRGFGLHSAAAPEATWMQLDDLPSTVKKEDQWMGELIPEHRSFVDNLGLIEAKIDPIEKILPSFLASKPYDRTILVPWYGRKW